MKGIPLHSPQLAHNWDIETDNPALTPFVLDGIFCTPEAALAVLLDFPTAQPGLVRTYAPSQAFRYWSLVASLTLETLVAQKFVPVVSGQRTEWLPVLDAPKDAARLAQLVESMPPVCRAEKPELSPKNLLTGFINTFCDALARAWGKPAAQKFYRSDEERTRPPLAGSPVDARRRAQTDPNQMYSLASGHRAWMRNLRVAVEVNAYRILLEAWNNVVKHARASRCLVKFLVEQNMLVISIQDDGVGMPKEYRAGVGLHSMRARAEEIGGGLSVDEVQPQGTRITARLPLSS